MADTCRYMERVPMGTRHCGGQWVDDDILTFMYERHRVIMPRPQGFSGEFSLKGHIKLRPHWAPDYELR